MTIKALNVRGTNGSGKTHIVRTLLEGLEGLTPVKYPDKNKTLYYLGKYQGAPITILGSYDANCGGCDTIPSVKIVADLLTTLRLESAGIVVYEGLMISHMIGTVGAAAKLWGNDHVMAFLNTPLDVCIERVVARRKARGNLKEFDPRNVIADHPRVIAARKNALIQGFNVVELHWQTAQEDFNRELNRLISEYNAFRSVG